MEGPHAADSTNSACVCPSKSGEYSLSFWNNDETVLALPCCLILTWPNRRAKDGGTVAGAHRFPPGIMAPCSFDLGFSPVSMNPWWSLHPLAPRPISAAGPAQHRSLQLGLYYWLVSFSIFSFASLDHQSPRGAVFNTLKNVLHFP